MAVDVLLNPKWEEVRPAIFIILHFKNRSVAVIKLKLQYVTFDQIWLYTRTYQMTQAVISISSKNLSKKILESVDGLAWL